MALLMTKAFTRFARKARLSFSSLAKAATEVAAGKFDADLGGHVYKQRVAREGEGKSGGFRTIILFKAGGHSFFVHGFAKSGKANIRSGELSALKQLAERYLSYSSDEIGTAVDGGALIELREEGCDDEK
jgi:hypothetical protein